MSGGFREIVDDSIDRFDSKSGILQIRTENLRVCHLGIPRFHGRSAQKALKKHKTESDAQTRDQKPTDPITRLPSLNACISPTIPEPNDHSERVPPPRVGTRLG